MQDKRQKGKGWFVNEYEVIYVQGTVDGKFYRKTTGKQATPANIKWIIKNARDVLLKLIDNNAPKKKYGFNEFVLDVLELTKHKRSERTQKEYLGQFHRDIEPFFKNYKITDVSSMDIERWQNSLLERLSSASIKRARVIMSIALEKAVANDIISKNPISYADTISVVHEKREPYTAEEMRAIIDEADGWFKMFLVLAFSTGLRTGEVMGLQWEDVDFRNGVINLKRGISKGKIIDERSTTNKSKNHCRTVELINDVVEMLLKYQRNRMDDKWLFVTKYKEPFADTKSINNYYFKPLLKDLGIKYKTLYATRHTFTSMMLNSGFDRIWVKTMLGHSPSSTITESHYLKYEKNDVRIEAVNEFFRLNTEVKKAK